MKNEKANAYAMYTEFFIVKSHIISFILAHKWISKIFRFYHRISLVYIRIKPWSGNISDVFNSFWLCRLIQRIQQLI